MNRSRNLPGEYRREALVSVHMDAMEAMMFAPRKLAERNTARPGDALSEGVAITERYIVVTHRTDLVWDYTIEHDGVTMVLPGPVIDRIIAQRESIIKQARRDRGRDAAALRGRKEEP